MTVSLMLYIVLSIIMSAFWTVTTVISADLSDMGMCSKVVCTLYFVVANLIAWPIYCILVASMILNDQI